MSSVFVSLLHSLRFMASSRASLHLETAVADSRPQPRERGRPTACDNSPEKAQIVRADSSATRRRAIERQQDHLFSDQMLKRVRAPFAQKSAAFEKRCIGRRGMRGAVANELFTTGPAQQNSGCELLILVRPARLERATSWFVVVTRKIDRRRLTTTKIHKESELRVRPYSP